MIVACPSCHARYRFDESKLGSRPKARTKCAKCGQPIDIENPLVGGVTLPPEDLGLPSPGAPHVPEPQRETEKTAKRKAVRPEDDPARRTSAPGSMESIEPELPRDRRYSLAVIQGPATGSIYQLSRARITLGRSGADVVVDDPEASRQHCSLELLADHAVLRDLGSTNGTFVDNERIDQQTLFNHGEFRIGSHVLMFIITALE